MAKDQRLYFYEDGTYGGLCSEEDNAVIDWNRRWRWEVRDDLVWFFPEKGGCAPFNAKASRVIIDKIAEYYFLLDSDTKETHEKE